MRQSRPTWARGLKLTSFCQMVKGGNVAPHVGAWIETLVRLVFRPNLL